MTVKKLWAFNDAHNWGVALYAVAKDRGYDAHLFDDPKEPDEGLMMMHMHHHPSVRNHHKRHMQAMAVNPNLKLVPDYRQAMLYDDKLEQHRSFARWMPRTYVLTSPMAANKFLNKGDLKFPFVSKTSEGAGSNNVRFIRSMTMARDEVKFAFSDIGIRCKYGQDQRSYVLWQEFLDGNAGDWRIIAIGDQRLILKRTNRPDRPFASGSGISEPIKKLDEEAASALAFANKFFSEERTTWCGIDLVKDMRTGEWKLLETTVGWTMPGYVDCTFFTKDGKPTKRDGKDIWHVFLDEYEAGNLI